ncbi:MAG: hypothetical protein PVG44_04660 [Desulfobacterales bacterium]|jgi:hypothetical protein
MGSKNKKPRYTCADYRKEMILVSLKRRINKGSLSDEERDKLRSEIQQLESEMNMD